MNFADLKPTPVYDTYWKFAVKRQEIFFNRMEDKVFLWTDDEILKTYKFTNAYRASDRVSQYLIKNVIYSEGKYTTEDKCFRILLFKLFNKIETWKYLENNQDIISMKTYNYDKYIITLIHKAD